MLTPQAEWLATLTSVDQKCLLLQPEGRKKPMIRRAGLFLMNTGERDDEQIE
jgi:hypothetical protein